MNRILLTGASVAALLVAAPALAQNNDSDVTQSGSGAVATVDQTGANDVSDITQTGGGTVNVNQAGVTGSTSTVTTSADDRPPESTVTLTQSDAGYRSARPTPTPLPPVTPTASQRHDKPHSANIIY